MSESSFGPSYGYEITFIVRGLCRGLFFWYVNIQQVQALVGVICRSERFSEIFGPRNPPQILNLVACHSVSRLYPLFDAPTVLHRKNHLFCASPGCVPILLPGKAMTFAKRVAVVAIFVGIVKLSVDCEISHGLNPKASTSTMNGLPKSSTMNGLLKSSQQQQLQQQPFQVMQLPNPRGDCDTAKQRNWDSVSRADRFPGIEERVCHLMTVWYDQHFLLSTAKRWVSPLSYRYINETDNTSWKRLYVVWDDNSSHNMTLQNKIGPDFPFHVAYREQEILRDLGASRRKKRLNEYDKRIELRKYMYPYANDFVHIMDAFGAQNKTTTPIVALFGDKLVQNIRFPVPLFAKWRFGELDLSKPNPIVWRMESMRHLGSNDVVKQIDLPWEEKKNVSIFRGRLTGYNRSEDVMTEDIFKKTNYTIYEACMIFERCALAYKTYNSSLADVGLTHGWPQLKDLNGRNLMKGSLDTRALLAFKMIISVEGNDVASGLKWGLLSNSVILMVPPAKTTFVMEHLLEPWVHYIPLDPGMHNVDERTQWVLDHDEEAKRIAQRATTFINDLLYHPNATKDEQEVMEQIALRYASLWPKGANE